MQDRITEGELRTYLELSGVADAGRVAEDILARFRTLAKFYGGLAIAPLLARSDFSHTFAVVPLEDYSLAFSVRAGVEVTPNLASADRWLMAVERDWSKSAAEGTVSVGGLTARTSTVDEGLVATLAVAADLCRSDIRGGASLHEVRERLGGRLATNRTSVVVSSPEYLYALSLVAGAPLPMDECRRLLVRRERERRGLQPFEQIIRVLEGDNTRLAVLYGGWGNDYNARVYLASDPDYEYIDEGSFVSHNRFGDYNDRATVVLTFDPHSELNEREYRLASDIINRLVGARRAHGSRRAVVVGLDDFRREVLAHHAEERMREARDKQAEEQKAAIERRVAEGGFAVRGIQFSRHFITYQGQKMGIDGVPIGSYIKVSDLEDEGFDFVAAYSRLVELLFWGEHIHEHRGIRCVKDHGFRDEFLNREIWVGSFPITVTKETLPSTEQAGERTFYSVNGVRLGRADLRTPEGSEYGDAERRADGVIDRALCFNSAESYAEFLKSVSEIPLRAHDLLVNGAVVSVEDYDSRAEGRVTEKFVFKVVRDGQKYHFKLEDKLAHIKGGFNEILRFVRTPDWRQGSYSSPMGLYRALLPLVGDERTTVALVKDARREFVNTIERARQLLAETLERLGDRAQKAAVEHGGSRYEGYIVRGRQRSYFVDEATNKVFEHPSMAHICIVDKSKTGREMNRLDRLVTRIYALANDSTVADEVHTLRGR